MSTANERGEINWYATGVRVLVGITVVAVFPYVLTFYGKPISSAVGDWGVFGDYFGGTVGTAFTAATFFIMAYTLYKQREDIEFAKKMQAHQRFESTFFSMLDQHNKLKEAIFPCEIKKARDIFFKDVLTFYSNGCLNKNDIEKALIESQEKFFLEGNEKIAPYFIYLFQILKFIDGFELPNEGGQKVLSRGEEEEAQKKLYSNMLRAVVPSKVLQILAINCFCGEDGEKNYIGANDFKKLLEKFAFFEHMQPLDKNEPLYGVDHPNHQTFEKVANAFSALCKPYQDKGGFGKSIWVDKIISKEGWEGSSCAHSSQAS